MVFSSITFLFTFLPIVLLLYHMAPDKAKNGILWIASLAFYAWGEPVYVLLMILSTCLDYMMGRMVEHYRGKWQAKLGLIISLAGNLGLLGVFKYAGFVVGNINAIFQAIAPLSHYVIEAPKLALPIGISFYTFQTMSYTIDVYRGEVKAQHNFITFGAFVALFPQLIAGPIVRYQDIAAQLEHRSFTWDGFAAGIRRFLIGMSKKVLLANNIGLLWDTIGIQQGGADSVLQAWLGAMAYAFQIYFDFSGYSDMAIGLGKMFGFDFPENFNYPYISLNFTEFWRRWHMTLGRWFRDYVYIPLGGNRRGKIIWVRNIFIVWFLTGFWHGASWNFVLWGLFFGVLLMAEKLYLLKLLSKLPRFVQWFCMWGLLNLSWILFALDDLSDVARYWGSMFGLHTSFCTAKALYQLSTNLLLLAICALAATPLPRKLTGLFKTILPKRVENLVVPIIQCVAMAFLMLLCTAYLVSGSYNPFLYFRF